jgi:hypothetical protein
MARRRCCSVACVTARLVSSSRLRAERHWSQKPPCTCTVCGVVFRKRWRRGLCCSRVCGFEYQRRVKAKAKADRIAARPPRPSPDPCRICGRACPHLGMLMCSLPCRRIHASKLARVSYRPRGRDQRTCKQCRGRFLPSHGGRTAFCSQRCAHRFARRGKAKNAEARARRLGALCDYSITNEKVFRRDRWRCQLCGRSTPQRLKGTTDPAAPELDHILPFAAGGSHTWDNVQCACRACNCAKADKPLGQLRLAV